MPETRQSITPTYDHRETGDRYWVTSTVNGHPVAWRQPIEAPFVRHTVRVSWRDLLSSLLRRRGMTIEVTVGGDAGIVEDVLELNANYLGPRCTRREEFHRDLLIAMDLTDIDVPPTTEETSPDA